MIVGTAGHIDHGKTSLVRALTGVDTDRLKEEKARGISIELGFAYLPAPDGSILGFIDVPGHERFVHTMLAGAGGVDFVLLVVAADDGVMPQTAEHLAIVDLLGIDRGMVAITKADLVSAARLDEVLAQIGSALAGTVLAGAELLPVSSQTGAGIETLRDALFDAARRHGSRSGGGGFRLAVDRCFTLQGAGTVVTGTVLSGQVKVGDKVLVSPSGIAARVRAIRAQNRATEVGRAGDRCALNLAGDGVSKDAISRGDMVVDPVLHAPADRIDASVRVLASESKPLTQWMPVRLHHAAAEVGARVVLLGDGPVPPGGEGFIQLVLDQSIAAAVGDRYVLRDTSAQRTIGGGRLLDLRAPTRKRRTPERLAQLEAASIPEPEAALAALLDRAPGYVDLTAFMRDRAVSATEETAICERTGLFRLTTSKGDVGLSSQNVVRLKSGIIETLEKFHAGNPDLAGLATEKLRLQLEPRLPSFAFAALLQVLAREKVVLLDGASVRLPGHELRLTPQDEVLWNKIRPLIGGMDRFRPPRVRDIADLTGDREADLRRLFKLSARMGRVDEVAQDHFFLRGTVAEMVEIAASIADGAPDGQFSAAELRDRLDNGRKVAIQILEFFDRHGITVRKGDLRRINPQRLDLFRRPADEPASAGVVVHVTNSGRASSPVGRPDFKSGKGRQTVLGGFDSHSLPPKLPRRGA